MLRLLGDLLVRAGLRLGGRVPGHTLLTPYAAELDVARIRADAESPLGVPPVGQVSDAFRAALVADAGSPTGFRAVSESPDRPPVAFGQARPLTAPEPSPYPTDVSLADLNRERERLGDLPGGALRSLHVDDTTTPEGLDLGATED